MTAERMKRYWRPHTAFDWATGGRHLSHSERNILRSLLLLEGRGETPRRAERSPRKRNHSKKGL